MVDQKQRQSIYDIQKEYKSRIDDLKAQLETLIKERNDKILDVLTPEQRQKVEAAKEAAAEKRAKRAKSGKPKKSG